jgi:hypothetical protein
MQRSDFKTRVFIPVMTYQNPDYAMQDSLRRNIADLAGNGMVAAIADLPPSCYIAYSRIMASYMFLKTDCTHLFFWDTDVLARADAVRRLVKHDRDITFAPYPKKKTEPEDTSWPVQMLSCVPDEKGLMEAYLVATGFLLIKRHVIETMWEKYRNVSRTFYDKHLDDEVVDLFPTGILDFMPKLVGDKTGWWGEDYSFSYLAREAGFQIWLDPNIRLAHVGRQVWHGEFSEPVAAE